MTVIPLPSARSLIQATRDDLANAKRSEEDADSYYKAAGIKLKQLKEEGQAEGRFKQGPGSDTTWSQFVLDEFDLKQSRADELIRIAEGKISLEKSREQKRDSVRRSRSPAPRGAGLNKESRNPALRSAGFSKGKPTPAADSKPRRKAWKPKPGMPLHPAEWREERLRLAHFGSQMGTHCDWSGYQIDQEVVDATRATADTWNKLVAYLEELMRNGQKQS
jgi:hypothetical protein